jgi:hypothetical protein
MIKCEEMQKQCSLLICNKFFNSFFQCDTLNSHCETMIRHKTSGINRILAIREVQDLFIMFIGLYVLYLRPLKSRGLFYHSDSDLSR